MDKKEEIHQFNPTVRLLTSDDNYLTNMFDSGVFAFNHYIIKSALNDMKVGEGVTYLVINEFTDESGYTSHDLMSYYTISTASINFADEPDYEEITEDNETEHYFPQSAIMINMFAVSKKYQDKFFNNTLVSSLILQNIIIELYNMSVSVIGAKYIILCAVPEAVNFYKRNNFVQIPNNMTIFDKPDVEDNVPMYLLMH